MIHHIERAAHVNHYRNGAFGRSSLIKTRCYHVCDLLECRGGRVFFLISVLVGYVGDERLDSCKYDSL